MKTKDSVLRKVWSKVDEKELVALAMDLVSTPSTTGSEEAAARLLVDWLNERISPPLIRKWNPGAET